MIRYILREGFAGFKRAKLSSTISIITIVITLVLLGAFVKLAINAASVIEQVRSQFEVELFLTDAITNEDIYEVEKKLQGNPFTKSTKFVSKTEAAKIFEKEFGEDIVQMIGMNPLPPSIKVKAQSDYVQTDSVTKFISQFEGDSRVLDTKYNLKFLRGFQKNTRALAAIGFGLGILLIAASISLVSNTTRLAILAKQDMIKTMKLVGATYSYIILPFILEGVIQGAIGGIVSAVILFVASLMIELYYPSINSMISNDADYIYFAIAIFGVLLGLSGSLFSIRRFIKI